MIEQRAYIIRSIELRRVLLVCLTWHCRSADPLNTWEQTYPLVFLLYNHLSVCYIQRHESLQCSFLKAAIDLTACRQAGCWLLLPWLLCLNFNIFICSWPYKVRQRLMDLEEWDILTFHSRKSTVGHHAQFNGPEASKSKRYEFIINVSIYTCVFFCYGMTKCLQKVYCSFLVLVEPY